MSEPYDLIEVIVHSAEYKDTTIPTDDEREQKWREINLPAKDDPLACEYCVRGIKDMQNGKPVYCQCSTGKHKRNEEVQLMQAQETAALIGRVGENIVNFFRNLFGDKN